MEFSREDTKAIKGVAIFLMLYHHLFAFPDRIADGSSYISFFTIGGQTSASLIGEFGRLCVPLFVFLGGYGTYYACQRTENITQTLTSKIKALYFSYWKIFIIFIPICMLLNVERVSTDFITFLYNFTGINITYCGEWWFFTPYVGLLLGYPILHRLMNKRTDLFTDVIVVLIINVVIVRVIPTLYGYTWASQLKYSRFWIIFYDTLELLPTFAIGCIFAKYNLLTALKQKFSCKIFYGICSVAIMFCIFVIRIKTGFNIEYLLAPAFVMALVVFFENIPLKKYIKLIFIKVGNESTNIWLVHSIYCYLICQRIVYLPKYSLAIFILLLAMSYITSILIKKIFALFVKRDKKAAPQ